MLKKTLSLLKIQKNGNTLISFLILFINHGDVPQLHLICRKRFETKNDRSLSPGNNATTLNGSEEEQK
jgi:hypothetical protein